MSIHSKLIHFIGKNRLDLLAIFVLIAFGCKEKSADSFRGSNATRVPLPAPSINPLPTGQNTVVIPSTMPVVPTDAVTKGSFSVWTVPSDPTPKQDYRIVIQVKLPSNTSSYSMNDLSGQVIGTDNYTQPIGASVNSTLSSILGGNNYSRYYNSGEFNHNGDSATLSVLVPGADTLIRDTIQIRSGLLGESQEISIVF